MCYSTGNFSKTKKKLKSQINRVIEGCTNVIIQHKQLYSKEYEENENRYCIWTYLCTLRKTVHTEMF